MTAGKPQPTSLQAGEGNPANAPSTKAERAVVACPVTNAACLPVRRRKVEWGRVCSALYAAGLMTELRPGARPIAPLYGRWAQTEQTINRMAAAKG